SLRHFLLTDPAPTQTYPLSLHDALPISHDLLDASGDGDERVEIDPGLGAHRVQGVDEVLAADVPRRARREGASAQAADGGIEVRDRKSTRLNSSHVAISYAVFCLKKKIP